jgi:SAM-dependent methyltransferase
VSGALPFKDHFSGHASGYARARPTYPAALFAYLASLPASPGSVWECGAGSGQASGPLAERFRAVIATDASAAQVANGQRAPHLLYAAASAERAPLRDGSIDLVAVAQALHWFDLPAFCAEAARVARPGAVLAAWCYGNCKVTPAFDRAYDRLYGDIVGPYWPPERVHVENGYRSLDLPFPASPEFSAPDFAIAADWDLGEVMDYFGTWSAVQYYRKAKGADPLALVREEMAAAWGDPAAHRRVRWPLSLRLARLR